MVAICPARPRCDLRVAMKGGPGCFCAQFFPATDPGGVRQKMEIKGRTVYRVRLGPFHSRRKADVALRHLRDNGFDALLIKQP